MKTYNVMVSDKIIGICSETKIEQIKNYYNNLDEDLINSKLEQFTLVSKNSCGAYIKELTQEQINLMEVYRLELYELFKNKDLTLFINRKEIFIKVSENCRERYNEITYNPEFKLEFNEIPNLDEEY